MTRSDPTTSPPRPPRPRKRDPRTDTPHDEHVRRHIARLGEGVVSVAEPGRVFLGPEETEDFWELIGLRLSGVPRLCLAALRFHRHRRPDDPYARESLAAYLTSPPRPRPSIHGADRAGEITAYLPRWHETPAGFLDRLRDGSDHAPVVLSPDLVEVAFDFRPSNPSAMEAVKRMAGPMAPHLVRTTGGHVLRGLSHGVDRNPGHANRFVALAECEQITPRGKRPLPPVMLNRDFVAVSVRLEDEKTRLAAPNWVPFLPLHAAPRHLLLG